MKSSTMLLVAVAADREELGNFVVQKYGPSAIKQTNDKKSLVLVGDASLLRHAMAEAKAIVVVEGKSESEARFQLESAIKSYVAW